MNEENSLLEIRDLTLRRGSFLLDRVSLRIGRKEIFAILGKTGSGKTLMLEAIAGFTEPDAGGVWIGGKNIWDIPITQRSIGYLYQDYCLFPHMTARQNIAYGLRVKKVPRADIARRVEAIAKRFEITPILEQYPGTLSGGEQQRVALARALVMRPSLLLLDEPFSALDPVTKKGMYRMLHEIRDEFSCAVVFVTHNFAEAQELADRIGVMVQGKLCGVVDRNELYTVDWQPEVKRFLGIGEENT